MSHSIAPTLTATLAELVGKATIMAAHPSLQAARAYTPAPYAPPTDIDRKRAASLVRQRVQWGLPPRAPAHMVGQWRTCEHCGNKTAHVDCGWCSPDVTPTWHVSDK